MHDRNGAPLTIITIGGSAGALEPLQRLVSLLPDDLAASVFVTMHTPPDAVSALPHILSRAGPIFAAHAIDGAPFKSGQIYIAPPDRHLLVGTTTMHVTSAAKENGHRPSIDVLFRSAAQSHGSATCAVLLSGTLDDGVSGMEAVQSSGGLTIAQDPQEAQFSDMPGSAVRAGVADRICSSVEISQLIRDFSEEQGSSVPLRVPEEATDPRTAGLPSIYTCPDCHGTLWELESGGGLRFRCRTGHSYNPDSIVSLQRDDIERSLYAALRALQERADILRRMARSATQRGDSRAAKRFEQQASAAQQDQERLSGTIDHLLSQH